MVYVLRVSDTPSEALVLLGHGTELNPDSASPVLQHAEALRSRGLFAETLPAFWKQEPRIHDVLGKISASKVFIVPMFISQGYFGGEVIPAELGFEPTAREAIGAGASRRGRARVRDPGHGKWFYTEPVGTHPAITGIILSRAAEVLDRFPFPRKPAAKETTLLIVGHGTKRSAESRKSVEAQAERIRAQDLYSEARAIFMEEEPFIRDWRRLTQTRNVIVVPFFIAEGLHVAEDIPALLGEPEALVKERLSKRLPTWRNPTEKSGALVWYASSVGASPMLQEIILDRVKEAREADG